MTDKQIPQIATARDWKELLSIHQDIAKNALTLAEMRLDLERMDKTIMRLSESFFGNGRPGLRGQLDSINFQLKLLWGAAITITTGTVGIAVAYLWNLLSG